MKRYSTASGVFFNVTTFSYIAEDSKECVTTIGIISPHFQITFRVSERHEELSNPLTAQLLQQWKTSEIRIIQFWKVWPEMCINVLRQRTHRQLQSCISRPPRINEVVLIREHAARDQSIDQQLLPARDKDMMPESVGARKIRYASRMLPHIYVWFLGADGGRYWLTYLGDH